MYSTFWSSTSGTKSVKKLFYNGCWIFIVITHTSRKGTSKDRKPSLFLAIGKFVILWYDKILHTVYAKPTARKSSKASSKKSAKSFLAKKSAKLPKLSPGLYSHSVLVKGFFHKILLVSGIINFNFGLSAFILPKSRVKIIKMGPITYPHFIMAAYICTFCLPLFSLSRGLPLYLTLSFLSLPASHLCRQGFGWPCIIVSSIIYKDCIMTLRLQI